MLSLHLGSQPKEIPEGRDATTPLCIPNSFKSKTGFKALGPPAKPSAYSCSLSQCFAQGQQGLAYGVGKHGLSGTPTREAKGLPWVPQCCGSSNPAWGQPTSGLHHSSFRSWGGAPTEVTSSKPLTLSKMETAHVSDFQREGLLVQKGYYLRAGCAHLHAQMFKILRSECC